MSDEKPKKINCLKCKSLWIGLILGAVATIMLGLAVFNQSFYVENQYYFGDFIRFGLLIGGLIVASLGSFYMIKGFCFNDDGLDFLFGGIVCAIISIFIIMIMIYFVPMAYEESVLRNLDYDLQPYFVLNELNCNTFLGHNRYSSMSDFDRKFSFDDRTYVSDKLDKKYKECKN